MNEYIACMHTKWKWWITKVKNVRLFECIQLFLDWNITYFVLFQVGMEHKLPRKATNSKKSTAKNSKKGKLKKFQEKKLKKFQEKKTWKKDERTSRIRKKISFSKYFQQRNSVISTKIRMHTKKKKTISMTGVACVWHQNWMAWAWESACLFKWLRYKMVPVYCLALKQDHLVREHHYCFNERNKCLTCTILFDDNQPILFTQLDAYSKSINIEASQM